MTKENFKKDLFKLLEKYNAELEVEDHWQGYAECGSDVRLTVVFKNEEGYSTDELDLGRFVDIKDNQLRYPKS